VIVDTHVHVVVENPRHPRPLGAAELVRLLDAAGVSKAVVVPSLKGNGFETDYPAKGVRAFPDRLIPLGSALAEIPGAADRLRTRVREQGLRGCRVNPRGWSPADPRFAPLWELGVELSLPFLFMGPPPITAIDAMLRAFPELTAVIDHLGIDGVKTLAWHDIAILAIRPNCYVKFTPVLFRQCTMEGVDAGEIMRRLADLFGAARLIWGSDYPASREPDWPYGRALDVARSILSGFPTLERELMLGGAALRIWP
jgi:predicted TIM-barrel fold metal-dependent hydrolase